VPALQRLAGQVEQQRLLEDPDKLKKVAILSTLGVLDLVWVMGGLGLAYIIMVTD